MHKEGEHNIKKKCKNTLARLLYVNDGTVIQSHNRHSQEIMSNSDSTSCVLQSNTSDIHMGESNTTNTSTNISANTSTNTSTNISGNASCSMSSNTSPREKTPSPRKLLSPRMRKLSVESRSAENKSDMAISSTSTSRERVAERKSAKRSQSANGAINTELDLNQNSNLRKSDKNTYICTSHNSVRSNLRRSSTESSASSSVTKYNESNQNDGDKINPVLPTRNVTNSSEGSCHQPYSNTIRTHLRDSIGENKRKSFIVNIVKHISDDGGETKALLIKADDYDSLYLVKSGYCGIEIYENNDINNKQYYILYSAKSFGLREGMQISNSSLSQDKIIELYRSHFPLIIKSRIYTFSEEQFTSIFSTLMCTIHEKLQK